MHEQCGSISKFHQWMSEQKDFHSRAVAYKPTQWNAWRLVQGSEKPLATELHNLSDYTNTTKCSADAKFHDFFPFCKTLQKDFEICPKTTMLECHANLFLNQNLMPTPWATLARTMFKWLTKMLWILDWHWAYLTVLTEGETCSAWISSDHTISLQRQTDACCAFYWTH